MNFRRLVYRLAPIVPGLMALSEPAAALVLEFPGGAEQTGVRVERMTSYRMPVGPFLDGDIESRLVEGALDQRAWRVAAPGRSTLELMQPLRDQLTAAGFAVIYECEAVRCGGFDFRYGTEVLSEPEMHVDLGDFRYLAAVKETGAGAGPHVVSLIVSRAVDLGFVQVTQVGGTTVVLPDPVAPTEGENTPGASVPDGAAKPTVVTDLPAALPDADARPLAERLTTGVAQVLPDLAFASGSATLADEPFASLQDLAAFLKDNPAARVMLVGHTDMSGDLAANVALSRERARSVRQRMLSTFDILPRQIEAEGVGFLVPRAPNDTDAGRLANRRVEVMLLSLGDD